MEELRERMLRAVYPLFPVQSSERLSHLLSIRPCREKLQALWCNKYPGNQVEVYLFKYMVHLLSVALIHHYMLLMVLLFRQQTTLEMAQTHSTPLTLPKLNQLTY